VEQPVPAQTSAPALATRRTAIQRFAPDFRTLNLCHRYANGVLGVPNLQYLAAKVCAQLAVTLNGRGSPLAWNAVALEGPMLTYLRWFVPRYKRLQLTTANVQIRFGSVLGRGAQSRFGYLKWSLLLDEASPEDNPNGIDVATWHITGSPEGFHDFVFRTATKSKASHPIAPCLDRHDLLHSSDDHDESYLLPLPSYLFPTPDADIHTPTLNRASPGMLPAPKVRELPGDAPLLTHIFLGYVFQRRFKSQNHISTLETLKDIVSRGVCMLQQTGPPKLSRDSGVMPRYANRKNCVENAILWLYLQGHLDLNFVEHASDRTVGYDCVYRKVRAQPWKPIGSDDEDRPNNIIYTTVRMNFGSLCNLVHRSLGDLTSVMDHGTDSVDYYDLSPPHADDDAPHIATSQSLFGALPDYSPYCLEAVLYTLEYEGSVVSLYDLDDLGKWWARRF